MNKIQSSTPERRLELLKQARRSRLQWIINNLEQEITLTYFKNNIDLYKKIPAAKSLQNILNFLSNVISDGELISIETLVPPEGLDEDYDENLPYPTYEMGLSPYLVFIEKLKHPNAIDIVKLLQQFVTKVEVEIRSDQNKTLYPLSTLSSSSSILHSQQLQQLQQSTPQDIDDKIAKDIWAFLKQIHGIMKENVLWKDETSFQWENSMNSCEKFLFVKLYDCLFGNDPNLLEQDERIKERIELLEFLSPDHLDMKSLQYEWSRRETVIKTTTTTTNNNNNNLQDNNNNNNNNNNNSSEATIDTAVNKLRSISSAKCPSDKMLCLKEVSQIVIQVLTSSRKRIGSTSLPGADDFLPALILVIKEANPSHLHSTTAYIQRYTHPSRLVSESGYILTHFVSAIHFLETVDSTALTISPLEYEMCIARSKSKKKEVESEWKLRAREFQKMEEREMILKEDGQIISVSEFQNYEKEEKIRQQTKESKETRLREIYKQLRDERNRSSNNRNHNHHISQELQKLKLRKNHIQNQDENNSNQFEFQSHHSTTLTHKKALLNALNTYQNSFNNRETEILQNWSEGNDKILSYYYQPIETLSMSDVSRLYSEYRFFAQACASLVNHEIEQNKIF